MNLQKFLVAELFRRKGKNPSYSTRAFARSLGLSATAISQMMNGNRTITLKSAQLILEKCSVSPIEAQQLLGETFQVRSASKNSKSKKPKIEFTQIEVDTFYAISEWYYHAIVNLADTGRAKDNPEWLSRHLNITNLQAQTAIDRLKRLGLLASRNGILAQTKKHLKFGDTIASSAIRSFHRQNIERALKSLDEDSLDIRDMSSVIFALDVSQLPRLKKHIQDFRAKVNQFADTGKNKTSVYSIAVQLFPLCRLTENET